VQSPSGSEDTVLPRDNRLLLCGLLAAVAGGAVQNLIDSDWYVFFLGTTFWTLAGLAAGIAGEKPPRPNSGEPEKIKTASPKSSSTLKSGSPELGRGGLLSSPLALAAAGGVAAALLALTVSQGVAAGDALAAQGQTAADPGGAAQSYDAARAWDPLNGRYPSDEGFKALYVRSGDPFRAEDLIQKATALAPNVVNFRRLGQVRQAEGNSAGAIRAYQAGLAADPNSLELLLALARLSPAQASLDYYKRLSALELSPVGTARALGESVEPTFAYGDAALGDASAKADPAGAAYYARAAHLLEQYADDGGSVNGQREAMNGGRSDAPLDRDLGVLYAHVLSGWIAAAPPDQRDALRGRQKEYTQKFDAVITEASKPGIL